MKLPSSETDFCALWRMAQPWRGTLRAPLGVHFASFASCLWGRVRRLQGYHRQTAFRRIRQFESVVMFGKVSLVDDVYFLRMRHSYSPLFSLCPEQKVLCMRDPLSALLEIDGTKNTCIADADKPGYFTPQWPLLFRIPRRRSSSSGLFPGQVATMTELLSNCFSIEL